MWAPLYVPKAGLYLKLQAGRRKKNQQIETKDISCLYKH